MRRAERLTRPKASNNTGRRKTCVTVGALVALTLVRAVGAANAAMEQPLRPLQLPTGPSATNGNSEPDTLALAVEDLSSVLLTAEVESCARSLVKRAGYGVWDKEEAAWLVSACDSSKSPIACLAWPSQDSHMEAIWRGPRIPCGIVAQIHTHATRLGADPAPSQQDRHVAELLGIPVCALSTEGVFCFDPRSHNVTRMATPGWLSSAQNRGMSALIAPPGQQAPYSRLRVPAVLNCADCATAPN
jgi:hypothetical protein